MTNKISRRDFLGLAATGAASLVLGDVIGLASARSIQAKSQESLSKSDIEPFYSIHQPGIVIPIQSFASVAAFDVVTDNRNEIKELLQAWTPMIEQMMRGESLNQLGENPKLPPTDSGEGVGLSPARLTITVGFGIGLFEKDGVDRFGFKRKKPSGLTKMPIFHGDSLQEQLTHGDIVVQGCANDPIVCFHAIRNLAKAAKGVLAMRWHQAGQWGTKPKGTPRNLFGFKDGTSNPDIKDESVMNRNVWIGAEDGTPWLKGGSYMVVRRINMRLETWDQLSLRTQEEAIGRAKESGAPLDKQKEFDELSFAGDPRGIKTPLDSHVRLSNPRLGEATEKERILRRGFNFVENLDPVGRMEAGLLFICFNRNIQRQFESIQQRLTNSRMPDAMLKYTETTGGGYFVVPPGVKDKSSFIGQGLFL
jgi:deferrochelatase/peroxidase EfeB